MKIAVIQVIPFLVVGGLLLFFNTKWVFWILIASIPISINIELEPLALDVPTEPLMMAFMLVFLVEYVAGKYVKRHQTVYTLHVWIILMLIWLGVSVLFSDFPLRSI